MWSDLFSNSTQKKQGLPLPVYLRLVGRACDSNSQHAILWHSLQPSPAEGISWKAQSHIESTVISRLHAPPHAEMHSCIPSPCYCPTSTAWQLIAECIPSGHGRFQQVGFEDGQTFLCISPISVAVHARLLCPTLIHLNALIAQFLVQVPLKCYHVWAILMLQLFVT